jgi:pimeloyl-ACP methyl ester carboxylesterase
MAIDELSLNKMRRFEDPRGGFSEEFMSPTIGGAGTVAVLTRPLGRARSTGWVLCHSFGLEQLHLGQLEAQLARALAARGFPVLRYHGQGYGDSDLGMEAISLSSHLADASDAIDLMAGMDGVDGVGVIGARFGAAVAALVADSKVLPFMTLWDPPTRGSQFVRDFLWTGVFAKMAGRPDEGDPAKRVLDEFSAKGVADVKGFLLTERAHDEIARMDLLKDLTRFRGKALVVGISRTGKPSPGIQKLADRLRALGAECSVEVRSDRHAAEFGQYHFRFLEATGAKRDIRLDLDDALLRTTADWCAEAAP